MKYGVCIPNYGQSATAEALEEISLEAEKLGYDSIWVTDHILMQEQSGTPYERIFETITSLSYLAGITKNVKLGISSLILAMRNPVIAAKQLATMDVLSRGRLMLAVAAGWNEREFEYLAADFHRRGRILDDSIRLLRALWKGDSSFQAKYIEQHYSDAVFEPKPLSKLEIWVGGVSPAAMKRAARLGDAWHPNAYPMDQFKKMVESFRSIAGSEKKKICVRIGINLESEKQEYQGPRGERRLAFSSDMEGNKKLLEELESLDISYLVVVPNHDGMVPPEKQLMALREFRKLI